MKRSVRGLPFLHASDQDLAKRDIGSGLDWVI